MANTPQGSTKSRYQYIPRVLAFLSRGEDVLLIKRSADRPIFPNLYNGVGGHVERGENVRQAIEREIEEESGLQATGLWLCAVVSIDARDPDAGILMFVFRGEAEREPKASDEGTLEWMHPTRFGDLEMVEDIPTLLPKVMAMKPGDAPLWGFYKYDSDGKLTINF